MTGFIDVLEPHTAKLLFRFDPIRDIIEVQRRGVKTVVDLAKYRATEGDRHERQDYRPSISPAANKR
jgi:hypothetical protein